MEWIPPDDWQQFETVESHTGGEPLRIVVDGFPNLPGGTILEKRRYVREHHDDLRTVLMWEPRGHADMYGAVLTDPVTEDGDVGVLFMHNEGYSSMCGHGVIALGAVLPEVGMVDLDPRDPRIRMDVPAGRVTATPRVDDDGRIRRVAFENVPSYVVALDDRVDVPSHGTVEYDLAFGGAYYAYCDADQFDVSLDGASVDRLIGIGRDVKAAVTDAATVEHPTEEDLGFLYGVVLTAESEDADVRNVCVFADGEVDRSPTGTGVSGHLAIQHARGALGVGDTYTVESIVGSTFEGLVHDAVEFHGHDAVVPVVEGRAHVTGRNTFLIDPSDPFREGFVLR